jgi:ribonuclease BN (tRNA processing enzyme)
VRIQFAGSGDAFGSGGRFQACIHVEAGGIRFLVDCGASSLIALRRLALDPTAIDVVLVSHLHGDHFGGLPFLILDAQFRRRARPLTIVGPPGIAMRIREAMEVFFPGSSTVERRFPTSFVELSDRKALVLGPLSVTGFEVVHPSGAPPFALRVACDDRVLAYSGDTEWTDALLDAAHGADLFVCEGYRLDRPVRFHLDVGAIQRALPKLQCRRLVVTHMGDDVLARAADLGIETAEDGKVIDL